MQAGINADTFRDLILAEITEDKWEALKISDVQYHLATGAKVEEKTARQCIHWLMKNYNRAKDRRLKATMSILASELGRHFKRDFIIRCVLDSKSPDGISVFGEDSGTFVSCWVSS